MGIFDFLFGKKKNNLKSNDKLHIKPEKKTISKPKKKTVSKNKSLAHAKIESTKVYTHELVLYHDNGNIRTKAILDTYDKPHGNCKEWYASGKIFKDQNFKHGIPHGSSKEYFENGNLRIEYNFKDGIQHGLNNNYYEDGSNDIIANFKNGKEDGLKEQYYPTGNLETRSNYVDGLMEGVHIYLAEDGEVIEEKIMQKGLDITMEIMQLMMDNDGEHMIKAGVIKDGPQEFTPGQMSQIMYDYYKKHNLHIDSAQVSSLKKLYSEGEITKEFYEMSMDALNQNDK